MSQKIERDDDTVADVEISMAGGAPKETEDAVKEAGTKNSRIEVVRQAVPVTDDPTLPVVTFRFWVLSFFFSVIASVIKQYYFFRTTLGVFSIFFVNLVSYVLGNWMAKVLPSRISIGSFGVTLNPGPFNIKEHALIGIAVSTSSASALAIDILASTDLYLHHRINPFGALVLIITTQCLGYGMAGVLRKYLVYPAEMVWWTNLVQVVFYNAIHNTDDFKTKRMVRGWSYMKFFWIVCGSVFIYQFIPQWLAPLLLYFDWICWINPFNFDFWALFNSMTGGGILSLSFDWNSIGGFTLYYPFSSQICFYIGAILSYWILLPILWLTNTMGTKTFGRPLTSHLYYANGTRFNVLDYLNDDFSLNEAKYDAGPPAMMTPMYALGFFFSFVNLAGCISHVACFHGKDIMKSWMVASDARDEDIHTKLMRAYPEVPQLWYSALYVIMLALSIMVCEVYDLQLPWWGLLIACLLAWVLALPISAMTAITGYGPGLNVITELICGYMLPGKPIANMAFKCYGFMAMNQCKELLSDLKLGHYMKIPPRAMFIAQIWGTVVGGIFNYFTMIAIINSRRSFLDGTAQDPNGLWTGVVTDTFWGSALIYGALGPRRMFDPKGEYGFVFYGFLVGAIVPVILWGLSKKFPNIPWSKFNISLVAAGMGGFPNGYIVGILPGLITCIIFQFYIARYHKHWWSKYTYILSAALDTGAALTGLFIFLFLGGGLSPKLVVHVPSWWGNHHAPDGTNAPYLRVNRCGAADGKWTGGTL
ncbi:MAG: OPT oligopeptide transporter protein-domain-containing protein [Benniella sp.]|nr:MAG: OPT oligopeptide transporter protein-domain-containing protein [Benniella sp.]